MNKTKISILTLVLALSSTVAKADVDSLYTNFQTPPKGYGEVPFYWWHGDTLTREHLLDHLDELQGKHISSLQVNYAHSDKGGKSWGLTIKSQPEIFSDEWWNIFRWFAHEAKQRGMTVSLSDYTLGVGQEQYVDEIINARPEMMGFELHYDRTTRKVIPVKMIPSFNPMHPDAGREYIAHFFQRFADKLGDDADNLNFFFSDELDFKLRGWLWDERFYGEFKKRKGYDIEPHLNALFENDYPDKEKYRLDYNDVMVSLSEKNFFIPLYQWHEQRGLIFGCDHGGRGKDVVEFGDYFRTQRWLQAPGCDQPNLQHDVVKNKVASSIAHLYNRPRTWLEGFYGSGWQTSSTDLTAALFANYAQGQNLLSLHGLYYSTPDSRWEWAPPCNHFRMPYWQHTPKLLECMERLSYLLSQGTHCADIAIIYPVESVVAGDGNDAVDCAFRIANELYYKGMDFDFIDYQSLQRADISEKKLKISGEAYQVLIVPEMKTMLDITRKKIDAFKAAGGIVIIQETDIVNYLRSAITVDFRAASENPFVNHRRIGKNDLYAVYNVPQDTECFFRSHGSVSLWNPWNGERKPLTVNRVDSLGTYLNMPLSATEMQLIVFNADERPTISTGNTKEQVIIELADGWTMQPAPCLDNKWGDYHWPATDCLIQPEVRRVTAGRKMTIGYDTYFYCMASAEAIGMNTVTPQSVMNWQPYDYSWEYGVENDCGHQGYHGMKGVVNDDFIRLGELRSSNTGMIRKESPARHHYLATYVVAPEDGEYYILKGNTQPKTLMINGKELASDTECAYLKKGMNFVVLHYHGATSTYLCFSKSGKHNTTKSNHAMTWYDNDDILPYAIKGISEKEKVEFTVAPGTNGMKFSSPAQNIKVWVNGKKCKVTYDDGNFSVKLSIPAQKVTAVRAELSGLDLKHRGAAAFTSFISQECVEAGTQLGDWGEIPGLEYYSGGMIYRNNFEMDATRASESYILDLGDVVSSAEVKINGKSAGIRLASPWRYDITQYLKVGNNIIEVTVYNTAHNHFLTVPTKYNKAQKSGLIGPVKVTKRTTAA